MLSTLKKYPYSSFAGLLILFCFFFILKGRWSNDFWEHAAVVRELSANLFHPSNPIINENIPHAFFSPYSLLVALFSILSGANAVVSLEFFAFFNLVFFIYSFYLFCKNIFTEKQQLIAFWGLLFILFFWGIYPIYWSGFYHIMVLGYVLPYPSTFVIALSFMTLAILAGAIKKKISILKIVILVLLCTIAFITHPMTAVFLFAGIISTALVFSNYSVKKFFLWSGIIIAPAILLSFLWPYFNVLDLLFARNPDFENDSKTIYTELFPRYWPVLFALPGIIIFRKERSYQFLIILLFSLILVISAGWILKSYGGARLFACVVITAHLITACTIMLFLPGKKKFQKIYLIILGAAFIVSVFMNGTDLIKTSKFNSIWVEDYRKYEFLRNCVAADELILSDESTNWYIPAFGGKVISSRHPLYWVKDLEERRNATKSFFDTLTSDSSRTDIIKKYNPDYILIDCTKVHLSKDTREWLCNIGQNMYKREPMELIKLNQDNTLPHN